MPHLRFRGLKLEELKEISTKLLDDLERIVESPRDYFTLELETSTFVFDGQERGNQYPFVHIEWFDRGQAVMEQVAVCVTNYIKPFGYEDVGIYFTNLIKEHYYENGQHF